MGIFIFSIFIIVFIISIPVYFNYKDKKFYKEFEDNVRKDIEELNTEYRSSYNDSYYESSSLRSSHTITSNDNDYYNDPMSPCCPWGYWSM